jgi:glycosyltransferase involved in cell wall biosynthesis
LSSFVVPFDPVRILLDYRPALRARTGVGEFVHELARALAAPGADANEHVTVFTTSWRDRPDPALAAILPRVTVIDRRIPVRLLAWAWNRLEWPSIERLAGPADVVHSQSPLLIPTARAASVITIHDLHFLSHPERSEAEMHRDFPALVHDHARRADHVIVSSSFVAEDVRRRLGVPVERLTVCSPGAPEWATAIAQERAARRLNAAIVFVGTLEPRKNIGGLLDAYARLRARRPDAPPLVLAGGVRESIRPVLTRLEETPLTAHVHVLGYVGEADKQRLYCDAAMLVQPSFDEGFGLPVLEAMACGVPVVVSNRGSLPEVAGDAATPVDPENAEALGDAMEQLLDREVAERAIARGLARAATFSWATCARQARTAYAAAMTVRRQRPS